ncbi:HlyD family efflux transporter periplasmic adaptor subunit [Bradyrhizobium frederickii]|uniref:HlyD family efflux transporter periplasmic adaptor subunit n=1 Tax=Bradyrhizobium frederickii TaxID=2560054 RepID=A0A4Y9PH71_9BRAD|nr:HlyD family secretion protein [Bradyrhizobium frederickii]TFV79057.1 HlyD family efflux transporter periplasmic adaptor subunit [Bradyrhizobium frederickii]
MKNQPRYNSASESGGPHTAEPLTASIDAANGASDLQHELDARLNPGKTGASETDAPTAKVAQSRPSRIPLRFVKAAAGIAIVAVFGWLPLRALLQTSSVEAIVNSRLVTLRSPIDGKISSGAGLSGDPGIVAEGTFILRVVDTRGDHVRLDDLRSQMSRLENERPSLVSKIASARAAQKDLARQAALFTEGRMRQLEARIAEIQASIEAAAARREEAAAAVERALALIKSGSVSSVELRRLTRDQTIALQTEIGARRRLDATQVELTAARDGTFLGDSYNDRPSSVQREEEMRQRAEGLTADLAHAEAQIAWLAGEIESERSRYVSRSEAELKFPVAGRVWEILTAPGEDVRAGQPLVRLLDCSGAVVTANVTESVYNSLQLGSVAHFRPSAGGPELAGTVVNLTGSAGAPANLAINPDALSKEPYRATISVPALNDGSNNCPVGRTGRVIFSADSAKRP